MAEAEPDWCFLSFCLQVMPGTTFPANVYPSASSSYRTNRFTPETFAPNRNPSHMSHPTRSVADQSPPFFNDPSYQSAATYHHPPPSMPMYRYHALQAQGPGVWDSNAPTIQPLMGMHTRTFPPPPAPPRQHKVWILDCKACGMFLSNRGMKVC